MRVDPNSDTSTVAAIAGGRTANHLQLGRDTASLSSAGELTQALAQTPEVRSEEVARATALVQDTSYPPQVLIQKLSVLFAGKLLGPQATDRSVTAGERAPVDDSNQ